MSYQCKLNAMEWQLYMMEDSDIAAKRLSEAMTSAVQAAQVSLLENELLSERKLAERIREDMYRLMNKYREFGARDTEPECVLVEELEKVFGLVHYSLER